MRKEFYQIRGDNEEDQDPYETYFLAFGEKALEGREMEYGDDERGHNRFFNRTMGNLVGLVGSNLRGAAYQDDGLIVKMTPEAANIIREQAPEGFFTEIREASPVEIGDYLDQNKHEKIGRYIIEFIEQDGHPGLNNGNGRDFMEDDERREADGKFLDRVLQNLMDDPTYEGSFDKEFHSYSEGIVVNMSADTLEHMPKGLKNIIRVREISNDEFSALIRRNEHLMDMEEGYDTIDNPHTLH